MAGVLLEVFELIKWYTQHILQLVPIFLYVNRIKHEANEAVVYIHCAAKVLIV